MFSPLLPPNPHVLPMAADQCHEKMSGKSDFLKTNIHWPTMRTLLELYNNLT